MSWIVWMLLLWTALSVPAFFVLLAVLRAAARREAREAALLVASAPLTEFYPTKHGAAMPVFEPTAAVNEAPVRDERDEHEAEDEGVAISDPAVVAAEAAAEPAALDA